MTALFDLPVSWPAPRRNILLVVSFFLFFRVHLYGWGSEVSVAAHDGSVSGIESPTAVEPSWKLDKVIDSGIWCLNSETSAASTRPLVRVTFFN
jgi:hypothetical protein